MTKVCLFEFDTHNDGVIKMQDFEYPCAFIVGLNVFDYVGNTLILTEDYTTAPNSVMSTIIGFGNQDTAEGVLYVEGNICKYNKIG